MGASPLVIGIDRSYRPAGLGGHVIGRCRDAPGGSIVVVALGATGFVLAIRAAIVVTTVVVVIVFASAVVLVHLVADEGAADRAGGAADQCALGRAVVRVVADDCPRAGARGTADEGARAGLALATGQAEAHCADDGQSRRLTSKVVHQGVHVIRSSNKTATSVPRYPVILDKMIGYKLALLRGERQKTKTGRSGAAASPN
jgi:hypothetical protein